MPYRAPDAVSKYAFCMLCGSEGPAGSACEACSVERPVPGAEPALRGARCPRCDVDTLAIAPEAACVVHACPRCHGVFVPPLAWDYFLSHPDRVAELEAKLPPAPPERGELIASVKCPACAREMERLRFAGSSDIVVDTCTAAHGTWLDGGELGAVVRFLAERSATGPGDEESRRAAEAEDFKNRMTAAAAGVRAHFRMVEAHTTATPRDNGTRPFQVLMAVLFLIALTALNWGRCNPNPRTAPLSSPAGRAAASSERALDR